MENISVTGEFGRKPALAFEGTPSDELVVEVLRAGDGQVVEAGDTITCHYYGAVFGSATDFDNSFDRGGALSFQIGVGMVIPGWDEGLVGKRVGDRVLLSIPAELGYGARGVPQAGIPGGATLVFVTDILGVKKIRLTGGEPLLRRDLETLMGRPAGGAAASAGYRDCAGRHTQQDPVSNSKTKNK